MQRSFKVEKEQNIPMFDGKNRIEVVLYTDAFKFLCFFLLMSETVKRKTSAVTAFLF